MEQNIDRQIEILSAIATPERLARMEGRLETRTRHMVMCLEDIFYPHNASATIRSSEAFGLQEIHAVQSLCHFSPSRNIVRGTDQWVDIQRWKNTPELCGHLRERGYRIVVTAPRDGGSTLETFDVTNGPFALFMGTEKTGISDWLMEQADDAIYIPMVGFAESLNISVSAAIITQELTRRVRQMAPQVWQIPAIQRREILAKWLRRSVRDADNILRRQGVL